MTGILWLDLATWFAGSTGLSLAAGRFIYAGGRDESDE
jgi:hypothetical protein